MQLSSQGGPSISAAAASWQQCCIRTWDLHHQQEVRAGPATPFQRYGNIYVGRHSVAMALWCKVRCVDGRPAGMHQRKVLLCRTHVPYVTNCTQGGQVLHAVLLADVAPAVHKRQHPACNSFEQCACRQEQLTCSRHAVGVTGGGRRAAKTHLPTNEAALKQLAAYHELPGLVLEHRWVTGNYYRLPRQVVSNHVMRPGPGCFNTAHA